MERTVSLPVARLVSSALGWLASVAHFSNVGRWSPAKREVNNHVRSETPIRRFGLVAMMVYTHVLNQGPKGLRSPVDEVPARCYTG